MTQSALRNKMLADLVKQRGLKTRGFRQALWDWVEECTDTDDPDDIEMMFDEYFGDVDFFPAAYKIEDDGSHLHVYELAISARVSDDKIASYGRIADGDGPLVSLHIFDRAGAETILGNTTVARFAFNYGSDHCWQRAREESKSGGGVTTVHEVHTIIHTTKPEERAILRAVYELGLFQPGDLK